MLSDVSYRNCCAKKSRERAVNFCWDKSAEETLGVLMSVLKRDELKVPG
jgi:hypothetical protein